IEKSTELTLLSLFISTLGFLKGGCFCQNASKMEKSTEFTLPSPLKSAPLEEHAVKVGTMTAAAGPPPPPGDGDGGGGGGGGVTVPDSAVNCCVAAAQLVSANARAFTLNQYVPTVGTSSKVNCGFINPPTSIYSVF